MNKYTVIFCDTATLRVIQHLTDAKKASRNVKMMPEKKQFSKTVNEKKMSVWGGAYIVFYSRQHKHKALAHSYANISSRTDGSESKGHVVISQMDLWCRHMWQLFRAYESCCLGWQLNVSLACNPQCSASFARHYKKYLVWAHKHSPWLHTKLVNCTLMDGWSMLQ